MLQLLYTAIFSQMFRIFTFDFKTLLKNLSSFSLIGSNATIVVSTISVTLVGFSLPASTTRSRCSSTPRTPSSWVYSIPPTKFLCSITCRKLLSWYFSKFFFSKLKCDYWTNYLY